MEEKDSVEDRAGSRGTRMVAVALNGGSKSKYVLRWAIDRFASGSKVTFKLLHVYPKINGVPTPMGNLIPLSQVREDVAVAYKKEIEWQKTEMILPFQKFFNLQKVTAEIVLIESDDIAHGISTEIAKHGIKDIVIGASNNGMLARRIKGHLLSSLIAQFAPSFCTVYVVSKGQLECLRPSDFESFQEYDSSDSSARYTTSTFDPGSTASDSSFGSSVTATTGLNTRLDGKHGYNDSERDLTEFASIGSAHTRSLDDAFSATSTGSVTSRASTFKTAKSDGDQPSYPIPYLVSSSEGQMNSNTELENLRIELRHIRGMYAIAQNETMDATRRLSDLSLVREEEAMKLREISEKEEKARVLAKIEHEQFEAAKREAHHARVCTEREAVQRREAEQKAARDSKEKKKLQSKLGEETYHYQKFTWKEIVFATSNFNKELKIGEGSYGTVYKSKLHHTTVAIKVLHSMEQGTNNKQFHKELEILSKIRHPHLVLLLGACPEQGCLVYEYMERGSLEDRLFRKDKTPPIPWYERFRIAWEVASSLAFLHNNKPKPIIHRDLKPANILLDHNFVSKIGDAGLCTMINLLDPSSFSTKSLYTDTNPVGTLCYIDPEYQRTGLISIKSDVYALGMVILQLLTAKPVMGIAQVVEDAIEEGRLMEVLDKDAGRWPIRETIEMAMLGVQCTELRRKDRPDLNTRILPILQGMKSVAEKAQDLAASIRLAPPNHFICPILEDVMDDPCVASDGYTYDRKAIELWTKDNDTSPTTNFPLANKNLIPNYNLRYAIVEWKSKTRLRQQC